MSYKTQIKHVNGENEDFKIMLYAISTCGWCGKTKKLLNDLKVTYDYVDVDLLNEKDSEEVDNDVRRFNPEITFPTMVINNKKAIKGFDEEEIRKALRKTNAKK